MGHDAHFLGSGAHREGRGIIGGYVAEAGEAPRGNGGPKTGATRLVQGAYAVLRVVHQVEVAHLVFGGGAR